MDWHNKVICKDLERHIALVRPKKVFVLATTEGKRRYGEAFELLGERVLFNQPQDCGVVAVVAENIPAARQLHMSLTDLKNQGLPVVYCIPERRIATQAPSWENSGLHYDGMFRLASQYLPTVGRGSYVEFGVFDGKSLILAYHALKDCCDRFFAFDSFKGIGGTEADETTHFKDGQYYANLETFRYNLKFGGVDPSRIQEAPGFFAETLVNSYPRDFAISRANIVHVDTDVYEPALQALDFISPVLPQGALLMFDDYDQLAASNEKGERRAVREWLARHSEFELEPYRQYTAFSRAFIIHRRQRPGTFVPCLSG